MRCSNSAGGRSSFLPSVAPHYRVFRRSHPPEKCENVCCTGWKQKQFAFHPETTAVRRLPRRRSSTAAIFRSPNPEATAPSHPFDTKHTRRSFHLATSPADSRNQGRQ